LERGFTGLWRRKFFFRLFWLVFDGGSKVFAWLWSAVVLQARWGGAFGGEKPFLWGQFLAENVLEMDCSENNQKRRFLLHVVVLVDF
jgi:hypothetical protein